MVLVLSSSFWFFGLVSVFLVWVLGFRFWFPFGLRWFFVPALSGSRRCCACTYLRSPVLTLRFVRFCCACRVLRAGSVAGCRLVLFVYGCSTSFSTCSALPVPGYMRLRFRTFVHDFKRSFGYVLRFVAFVLLVCVCWVYDCLCVLYVLPFCVYHTYVCCTTIHTLEFVSSFFLAVHTFWFAFAVCVPGSARVLRFAWFAVRFHVVLSWVGSGCCVLVCLVLVPFRCRLDLFLLLSFVWLIWFGFGLTLCLLGFRVGSFRFRFLGSSFGSRLHGHAGSTICTTLPHTHLLLF